MMDLLLISLQLDDKIRRWEPAKTALTAEYGLQFCTSWSRDCAGRFQGLFRHLGGPALSGFNALIIKDREQMIAPLRRGQLVPALAALGWR